MRTQEINQSELAERLGADRHMVSRWLNGRKKPSLETLLKISRVTGIKLEALARSSRK
jgi:transcriptional regulator with XRE-family HTH domain